MKYKSTETTSLPLLSGHAMKRWKDRKKKIRNGL